ncbi:MAG: hypothetical protein COB93_09185 [Sneathiella sp.]|nr:MAG: hypothetical protein COB93_09185 [Sneathiella sp.]
MVTASSAAYLVSGPDPYVQFGTRRVPVDIQRSPRASRMKLRIDRSARVILVLPMRTRLSSGLAFLKQEIPWIGQKIQNMPMPVPFRDGETVPVLGVPHRICHAPDERGLVWQDEEKLVVAGQIEHLPRRVRDWLRKRAKREISSRAGDYADELGQTIKGITVRDQKTRWGSCSSTGQLNFSWRLVLMPEMVMDYIIAHEVAHLRHMNHSAAFWALVGELHADVPSAKKWLKENGAEIHKYGIEPDKGV